MLSLTRAPAVAGEAAWTAARAASSRMNEFGSARPARNVMLHEVRTPSELQVWVLAAKDSRTIMSLPAILCLSYAK